MGSRENIKGTKTILRKKEEMEGRRKEDLLGASICRV
jgi:hypothetical protein